MSPLIAISVILAITFVLLCLRCWSRIEQRKLLRAGLYAMPAVFMLLSFTLLLMVISNLTIYQRLTLERDIARITIGEIEKQQYQIDLNFLDADQSSKTKSFILQGDEWRMEAKILKWQGWANLVGMDSYYQLDRISGRYRDIEQATGQPVTAFQLSAKQRGINLWELKRVMKKNLPFLDAYFGQGVFLPLEHGAVYTISINQSGLLARADNDIGQRAVDNW
ncbi:MAG: hypothetical protein GY820_33720 [Gammaproteobacteria bacterium]|nr:hypothetical protein [Gammaproteobacteria bacterium]